MIAAYIALTFVILFAFLRILAGFLVKRSPSGYQDQNGWHEGEQPK